MTLLEVTDVTRRFGGVTAVDHCSLAIREGSLTGLIGPNGAGKTTMFNLIAGALRPDRGQIRLSGKRLDRLRPHQIARLGVSRTFQLTRELADLTVVENVVVHAPVRTLDLLRRSISDAERARAMQLLELVGLTRVAEAPAGSLSYGQKKLLELAGALMPAPRLILLDEPAAGVNPALLDAIVGYIERVHRTGVTFLIVEHNMDLVMNVAQRVLVMDHGVRLFEGTPREVQANARVIEAYLGGEFAA